MFIQIWAIFHICEYLFTNTLIWVYGTRYIRQFKFFLVRKK